MKNDTKKQEIENYVINIWYSKNQKVLFSFWKSFFEFSGMFVNSFMNFNEENFKPILGKRKLFLLDDGQLDDFVCFEKECLYIVSQQEKQTKFLDRENVKVIRWENQNDFFGVIEFLFSSDEKQILMDLLNIFLECNMWSSIWLSDRMILKCQQQYLSYIHDNIQKYSDTFAKIQEDHYYVEFSSLFLQYLTLRFQNFELGKRIRALSDLSRKISNHSQYRTDLDAWLLQTKIGNVCPSRGKENVILYRSICNCLDYKDAFYLYCVGRELENKYGNTEEAMEWYRKAYQIDSTFYQALYQMQMAKYKEHGLATVEKWEYIIKLLKKEIQEDQIDFQALNYLYKSYCWFQFEFYYTLDLPDLEKSLKDAIAEYPDFIKNCQNFDYLFECMFPPNYRGSMKKRLLSDVSLNLFGK